MPANVEYTDIRLMRGSHAKVASWIPNPGEPIYDLDNYILSIGDGTTISGIPINAMTSQIMSGIVDLNYMTTIGRYFISTGLSSQPSSVPGESQAILEVLSSAVGGTSIFQILYVINGKNANIIYSRSSETQGASWGSWTAVTGSSFTTSGTGAAAGDTNLNNYTLSSQVYVTNMTNGPDQTAGANGILITYRPDESSPYVYQILYVTTGAQAGHVYYRYSTTKNASFDAPGYNWVFLDIRTISVYPTANYIPRANSAGKLDTGWLYTSDEIGFANSSYVATARAVYNLNVAKANAYHTHPYTQISGLGNAATRDITFSGGGPWGGKDGDIWFQYI